MKNKVKTAIIAVIVIAFAYIYAIVDINNAIYDTEIDNSDFSTSTLNIGDTLVQTFTAGEDILDGIEVKIAASGNQEKAVVSYQFTDDAGQIITEGNTALKELKNGKFYEFRFDRLSGCKGESYTFQMKLEECDDETEVLAYEVPAVSDGTEYTYNHEKLEETLALRAITHRFNLETFVVTIFLVVYVILFMRWLAKLFKG